MIALLEYTSLNRLLKAHLQEVHATILDVDQKLYWLPLVESMPVLDKTWEGNITWLQLCK